MDNRPKLELNMSSSDFLNYYYLKDEMGCEVSEFDWHYDNEEICWQSQEVHQTLTIGIAVVSNDAAHRQNAIDEIIRFMEAHADAELTATEIFE